jgi:flagellar protein FlbD
MIALQRLNGQEFILNADLVETIESTPDTRIKLNNGKTLIVKNEVGDVVKKCIRYRQLCNSTVRVVNDATGRGSE